MLADPEKLSDRIAARLERAGDVADFENIPEEELERRRVERTLPPPEPLTPELPAERERSLEEMNRAGDLTGRLAGEPEDRGWITEASQREDPVVEWRASGMRASGKLAGARNCREWPPVIEGCGMTIAWLRRARGYLKDALAAAQACAEENLTEPAWLAGIRAELDAIPAEVDALIAESRMRLERGFA